MRLSCTLMCCKEDYQRRNKPKFWDLVLPKLYRSIFYPKCGCVRWNQRYLDEELTLIDRLQDELYETGLIRESGEKIEYEGNECEIPIYKQMSGAHIKGYYYLCSRFWLPDTSKIIFQNGCRPITLFGW
jgi:hypothetical protein